MRRRDVGESVFHPGGKIVSIKFIYSFIFVNLGVGPSVLLKMHLVLFFYKDM